MVSHEEDIDVIESSDMPNIQTRTLATLQTPLIHKPNVKVIKRKIIVILSGLVLINIGIWVATAIAFRNFPALLGTAALAYTLGLRHAVDADHLAAIDNVTRKLLQSGQHSVSVGLFFSLGHSTIVIIASIAIAVTATVVKEKFGDLEAIGGLIGTSVSAAFLFIIGIVNCFLLVSILRSLKKLKRSGAFEEESMEDILNNSGLVGRFFGPVFKFIDASWKMYPLGVLFGFGFDTSTEVGLLGISAFQANQGLPIWLIMFFPLLFTSGMALIDTIDGILMLGTYTWAYLNPVRKLYYNFIITLLSVLVAFVIGIIELLNIIGDKLDLHGPFWDFFTALGEHFGTIGYLIIGLFVFTWIIAKIVYYCGGYEQLEHKFDQRNIEELDNEEQTVNSSSNQDNIKVVVDSGSKIY